MAAASESVGGGEVLDEGGLGRDLLRRRVDHDPPRFARVRQEVGHRVPGSVWGTGGVAPLAVRSSTRSPSQRFEGQSRVTDSTTSRSKRLARRVKRLSGYSLAAGAATWVG